MIKQRRSRKARTAGAGIPAILTALPAHQSTFYPFTQLWKLKTISTVVIRLQESMNSQELYVKCDACACFLWESLHPFSGSQRGSLTNVLDTCQVGLRLDSSSICCFSLQSNLSPFFLSAPSLWEGVCVWGGCLSPEFRTAAGESFLFVCLLNPENVI